MAIKEEERRWNAVIAQYNAEIGRALVGLNTNIVEGYLKKDAAGIALTERGLGYVEGTLRSKGITDDIIDNDPTTQNIHGLFEASDIELDIMACSAIYSDKYKTKPTGESLAILKRLLTSANIPKSE